MAELKACFLGVIRVGPEGLPEFKLNQALASVTGSKFKANNLRLLFREEMYLTDVNQVFINTTGDKNFRYGPNVLGFFVTFNKSNISPLLDQLYMKLETSYGKQEKKIRDYRASINRIYASADLNRIAIVK